MRHKVIAGGIAAVGTALIAVGCTETGTPVAVESEISLETTTSTSRTTTTTTRTTTTRTTTTTSDAPISDVPPPPNVQSLTCRDYGDLDDSTQVAVINAYAASRGIRYETPRVIATLTGFICTPEPDRLVFELLDETRDR